MTKKEIEEKLVSTELFLRYESTLYQELEKQFSSLSTMEERIDFLSYQCSIRDTSLQKGLIDDYYEENIEPFEENPSKEEFIKEKILLAGGEVLYATLLQLKVLGSEFFEYYRALLLLTFKNKKKEKIKIETFLSLSMNDLHRIFGEKRVKELGIVIPILRPETIDKLTQEEKKRLHYFCLTQETILYSRPELHIRTGQKKPVMVEIDLDKSRQEILEYIDELKDAYKKGKIKNIFEMLHPSVPRHEDINSKQINSVVDMLYIYDCRKMGFFKKTIMQELYSRPIKEKTIADYYRYISDIVDNKISLNPKQVFYDIFQEDEEIHIEHDYYDTLELPTKYS